MRERPILFSAPMVRAILDGRKSMTRRVVRDKFVLSDPDAFDKNNIFERIKNPYFVGNHLWLRETWAGGVDFGTVIYKADGTELPPYNGARWYPSIHMFRRDSRITLEITNVRVERLQEITEEDVEREGVLGDSYLESHGISKRDPHSAIIYFEELWDSINGNKYPWSSNPWVWVIEFRKVK